ncbi:MAG: AAA family ATPase, partial [Rhodocyclaceae bacterium]|nr:AAA family ATPase [Rhodocyclaceae bacterium]
MYIRDFVIADQLELEFGTGFSALTGETGAGKSILVDALGLALGGRAETGTVRAGAERAEVSAEFDVPGDGTLAAWLGGNDLDHGDGRVLLRRVVEAAGRSRAYINGTPATVQQLAEAGDLLADIHGQHAHHALLRPEAQRSLLDAHAGVTELAARVSEAFREWRRLHEARAAAESGAAAATRERELLEWQVRELRDLAFDEAEWRQTEADHRRLSNAVGLVQAVEETLALLDEGESAAGSLTGRALGRLSEAIELDPALAEAKSLVEAAELQLREAVHG